MVMSNILGLSRCKLSLLHWMAIFFPAGYRNYLGNKLHIDLHNVYDSEEMREALHSAYIVFSTGYPQSNELSLHSRID